MGNKYPCIECFSGWGDCNGNSCRNECNRLNTYVKKYSTNADYIRSMSDEELEKFLLYIDTHGRTLWGEAFSKQFCSKCKTTIYNLDGYYEPMHFHECDFNDYECPYGSDIAWWLKQNVKETFYEISI